MHCASCASIITDKVSKLNGVISCEVNFATKKAIIEFDNDAVNEKDLSQEVEKYGYSLIMPR
jgi:Cu+-exporting ATPase